MDTGGPKRKKRVVLKELEWELVRTFVKEYSAVAAKVTYDVLLAEMKKEYPDFHLENTAVKKHVGRIEKWKEEDGVPIQRSTFVRKFPMRKGDVLAISSFLPHSGPSVPDSRELPGIRGFILAGIYVLYEITMNLYHCFDV